MNRRIVQIVPRAPNTRDGVGDYAQALARRLRADHAIDTIFAVASGSAAGEEEFPVIALPKNRQDPWSPNESDSILLHYVNYGYQRRGVPLRLRNFLASLQRHSGTTILTIFHELYASGSWRESAFWLRPLQRRLARSIARLSHSSIVSSEPIRDALKKLSPDSRIIVQPVPSNFGEPALSPDQICRRDPHRWVICGGTELVERSLRSFLEFASHASEPTSPRELCVIGGSENKAIRQLLQSQPTIRSEYLPQVEVKQASDDLAGCAFGWIDYFVTNAPTSAILKSSAFAALCAHAVVPIFRAVTGAIQIGGESLPGPFAAHSIPREQDRPGVAQSYFDWYERHASSSRLAATVSEEIRRRE